MTELQRRFAVAGVGIPLAFAVIWLGDAALAALLGIIAALGAREFFNFSSDTAVQPLRRTGIALAALAPLVAHADRLAVFRAGGILAVIALLVVVTLALFRRGPTKSPTQAIALTLFGAAYTGVTISFGYLLRHHPYALGAAAGTALVFLPVALVWTCDTAAYAFGRKFGKRPLMPTVSPGKTWEGAAAGLIATLIVAVIYQQIILRPVAQLGTTLVGAVVLGMVVTVAAQVGDLAESMMKRSAGVKDSSDLLPGHGGILDRFDSLYFVLPVAYLLLNEILIPVPRVLVP